MGTAGSALALAVMLLVGCRGRPEVRSDPLEPAAASPAPSDAEAADDGAARESRTAAQDAWLHGGTPQRSLVVVNEAGAGASEELVAELHALRAQLAQTLSLPVSDEPIYLHLFETQQQYEAFLAQRFPNLPLRRAYFIGTPERLCVYTFRGDQFREDLRHEYTHALLHATLVDVPLWLDEGLAEYFEVPPEEGGLHRRHLEGLAQEAAAGWTPDLVRLEQLRSVDDMSRHDYREAWGWVYLMLHGPDSTRRVLLDYLYELQFRRAGPLSPRLAAIAPDAHRRLVEFVAAASGHGTDGTAAGARETHALQPPTLSDGALAR